VTACRYATGLSLSLSLSLSVCLSVTFENESSRGACEYKEHTSLEFLPRGPAGPPCLTFAGSLVPAGELNAGVRSCVGGGRLFGKHRLASMWHLLACTIRYLSSLFVGLLLYRERTFLFFPQHAFQLIDVKSRLVWLIWATYFSRSFQQTFRESHLNRICKAEYVEQEEWHIK